MIVFLIVLIGCMCLACKDISKVEQFNNRKYNDFKPQNNNFKRGF